MYRSAICSIAYLCRPTKNLQIFLKLSSLSPDLLRLLQSVTWVNTSFCFTVLVSPFWFKVFVVKSPFALHHHSVSPSFAQELFYQPQVSAVISQPVVSQRQPRPCTTLSFLSILLSYQRQNKDIKFQVMSGIWPTEKSPSLAQFSWNRAIWILANSGSSLDSSLSVGHESFKNRKTWKILFFFDPRQKGNATSFGDVTVGV